MEYLDLSPYAYRKFPLAMRTIGWLGREYGVQNRGSSPLVGADLDKLKAASRRRSSLTLGTHECEFCPEGSAFEGNGEYHYYSRGGDVYSAPMMILHYVEKHGYRPPGEFVDQLKESADLSWDWRAERLATVLLDESEDFDLRCEAIVDLANWTDSRAFEALRRAACDEELTDVAGDEIGCSLARFLECDFAKDLRLDDFPEMVRFGIRQAFPG